MSQVRPAKARSLPGSSKRGRSCGLAEVLEAVPGLIASQHSGEGKANQYLPPGLQPRPRSDFATTIAGVPVNLPAGGHAHGYSDTNALMTEIISGLQFKKGPYYAEDGDFSAAGSANINYVNRLERPIASASARQGWRRLFVAASPRVGAVHLLGGFELIQQRRSLGAAGQSSQSERHSSLQPR